jgi:hypothetical protein
MEIGDSRPFSPPGGSPKSQRGERGNLGEFGHLGLPGGAGHVLRHSHLDAAPPWAILACRVCRLGGIDRSTQRRAPGERGAVRTSQAAHPLAHRVLRGGPASLFKPLEQRSNAIWASGLVHTKELSAELAVTAACAPGR